MYFIEFCELLFAPGAAHAAAVLVLFNHLRYYFVFLFLLHIALLNDGIQDASKEEDGYERINQGVNEDDGAHRQRNSGL